MLPQEMFKIENKAASNDEGEDNHTGEPGKQGEIWRRSCEGRYRNFAGR